MKSIDINSIILHNSYADSRNCKIRMMNIDQCGSEDLFGYDVFVEISGLYTDGSIFQRIRCKISIDNYLYWKKFNESYLYK